MRTSLLAAALAALLVTVAVAEDDDAVSTVDILAVLEEINQKLDRDRPVSSPGAPDFGFGGGPILPVRYMPGAADLNSYFKKLGSYDPMREVFYPFADGGAGTLRWSVDESLQFGMEYGWFGQDVLGFARHTEDPLGPRDTIDADGDGYDDYYSYAGYGQFYFSGIVQYKWAVVPKLLYVQTGVKAGMGNESLRYGMNRRQRMTETLGLESGASSWDRTSLIGGLYAGVQIVLDVDMNVKLGIEAGVNGHYPVGDWVPATGVHKRAPAPPAGVQAHNFWFAIGPQLHY